MRIRRRLGALSLAFATLMVGGAALAAVGGELSSRDTGGGSDIATPDGAVSARRAPDAEPAPAPAPAGSPLQAPTADPLPRRGLAVADVDVEPVADDPPRIAILEPENGAEFRVPQIVVMGKTEPGAKVTLEDRAAHQDDEGNWKIEVELHPGKNVLVFQATDAAGNVGKAELVVYFIPEAEWRFTANQRWEVVDEDPATNVYWGTTKPGAEVTIRSEYGHGATHADREGHWETRVEFTDMPCNEPFRVLVQSGDHAKDFKMKKACAVDVAFTAHQRYGECNEPVPYDVFWGTAAPGATIWVESVFGGGVAEAGAEGHWDLRVDFPDAPIGKKFEVVVESSDGGRAVFTFVATGGEV
jgi:hypothetical protein